MASAKAEAILSLDVTRFSKAIGAADSRWQKFKKNIFTAGNAIGAMFAGVLASKVVQFGKAAIDAAREQEQAEIGLSQALLNTGQNVGLLLPQMTAYADQMQRATRFGDEQIVGVMAQLTAYGVMSDKLKEATSVALDWAASGKSIESISEAIGKAVQGNTQSFQRWGIQMEAGRAKAEGIGYVLSQMGQRFKGLAEEQNKGPIAQMEQLGKAWGEIKEGIGTGLAEGITKALQGLMGTTDAAWDFKDALDGIVTSGIADFVERLAVGFTQLYAGIDMVLKGLKLYVQLMASPFAAPIRLLQGKTAFGNISDTWGSMADSEAMAAARRMQRNYDYNTTERAFKEMNRENMRAARAAAKAAAEETKHTRNQIAARGR